MLLSPQHSLQNAAKIVGKSVPKLIWTLQILVSVQALMALALGGRPKLQMTTWSRNAVQTPATIKFQTVNRSTPT